MVKHEFNIPQEKPIYFYKLSKDLKLLKYVVNEYTIYRYAGRERIKFYGAFGTPNFRVQYLYCHNEGRFLNGSYFSFEDDDQKAYDTIVETYKRIASEYAEKLDKINEKIQILMRNRNDNI